MGESVKGVGHDGYAVCDEAFFGGHERGVDGCGDTVAAVVANEGVGVRDAAHGAVDGRAPAEGERACVLCGN